MDNLTYLVKLYLFVCDAYEDDLKYCVQRFSNNNNPAFTDEEIMTIVLYCISHEKRLTIIDIHRFASTWLRSWFPLLPSYTAFVMRINRLAAAFTRLLAMLAENYALADCSHIISLVDSMPVITCSAKRCAKVAAEITDKGYCSTKSIYYYGVKMHMTASRREGGLPMPERLIITPASENDLNVFRDNWSDIGARIFFADKAYQDKEMQQNMLQYGSELLSPVKYPRGVPDVIKQMGKAADDMFSRAVSAIRQPIESLFAWLIEKTDIQRASKVRATNGLIVHIFSKIAAVLIKKIVFNS
jgi:hypothetical protein